MKKIGVIANCTKERAADVLCRLYAKAQDLGLELLADEPTATLLGNKEFGAAKDLFEQVEAIIALGGDGTMIRAVREMAGVSKPIIGVNIGSLGFLTSVAEEDMDKALECLAKDDFEVSVRTIAECEVEREGKVIGQYRALNDVAVNRGPTSRAVTLDVTINGEKVSSYFCDGVIVSTPTGSTGYSLSAGGPIVKPETQVLVLNVICPHTLSSRPLVVSDDNEICIHVSESAGELLVSVDGQVGQALECGDVVKVKRGGDGVHLIHLPGHNYFSVLSQKLGWSGKNI